MSEISVTQLEQGMRILDLESELGSAQETIASLSAQVSELEALKAQVHSLESDLERQRLELLAEQRKAQLATVALEKAEREIPTLKTKLSESDKERKALKALNPERMKRNLAEQKRKAEEAKSAVIEWKQRTKESRDAHKAEVRDLHKTLLQMLEERDQFAELDGFKLTMSRYRFPDEPADQKTKLRIRVTNMETSESVVVLGVGDDGEIQTLSGMEFPDSVAGRVRAEWKSIGETGKVTKESSDHFDLFKAAH